MKNSTNTSGNLGEKFLKNLYLILGTFIFTYYPRL